MIKPTVSIIFSKDRALQLQACLDSFYYQCTDSNNVAITVLYHTTKPEHTRQYNVLKHRFPDVKFAAETNIVDQLLTETKNYVYVLLQCDDNLFINSFAMLDVIFSLDIYKDALGFSLRLGKNTTKCYTRNACQRIPKHNGVVTAATIIQYPWEHEQFDFGYPLEVSSSVYRIEDVETIWMKNRNIIMPRIEDVMNKSKNQFLSTRPNLLCYKQSVAFSNPMNEVSKLPANWANRVWGDKRFTVEEFAQAFDDGHRINIEKLSGFVTESAHQEVDLELELIK